MLSAGLLNETLAQDALAQRVTRSDLAFAFSLIPIAARAPGLAMRFLPLAAKSGFLDRLGGRTQLRSIVASLVGDAPRQAGEGPWEVPSASPARPMSRHHEATSEGR